MADITLENKTPEEIYNQIVKDLEDKLTGKIDEVVNEKIRLQKQFQIASSDTNRAKEITYKWFIAKLYGRYEEIDKLGKEYPEVFKQVTTTGAPALVPYYFIEQIIKKIEEVTWHRKYCSVLKVQSARGWVPKEGEGCVAYWTAEGAAPPPSSPTYGQIDFTTYELKARTYVSEKLVETAGIDIIDHLIYLLAKAIAQEEFKVLITGNGTNKWKGLDAYTEDDGMHVITYTTLTYDNLIDAIKMLEPDDLVSATWIANKQTIANLYKMKDATGRPYFDPEKKTILGYEVLSNSNIANDMIYFGNLKRYWIFDQANYTVETERGGDELRSKSLVGLYARNDSDGKLTLPSSFVRLVKA